MVKTVSFDEKRLSQAAQQQAKGKRTIKKVSTRQQQDEIFKNEDEESFENLMRTESGYSDIFNNLFDDDDFSLATPTIYTDATDETTTLSSSPSSTRKSKDRQRKSSRRSRSTAPEDEGSFFDFDFATSGCRGLAVLEELKIFTELFATEQQCICNKSEEPQPYREGQGYRGRGRSRNRRSRRSRSQE
jgi:hypothetical protein